MALRAVIRGSKFYLPNGDEFIPFGTNSRWELNQPRDGAYLRQVLGVNTVRIEIPFWQTGSAGDARQDGAPGHFNPTYLDFLREQFGYYSAAGLWIAPSIHSKCGRSGADDGAGLGAYCGSTGMYASGHNFWSDPAEEVIHDEMLHFLATTFKDFDRILHWEPINEPDPPGVPDADISAYYTRRIATMQAANPDDLYLIGANGGYLAAKIDTVFQAAYVGKVAYTCDLFNQQGSGADVPSRLAQWATRFQNALDMRAARDVPIVIQQFGSMLGDDPDRSNLAGQLAMLLAGDENGPVGGYQWESRAPGPGSGTFGWLQLGAQPSDPDIVRTVDEILMQNYARAFAALAPSTPPATPAEPPRRLEAFA